MLHDMLKGMLVTALVLGTASAGWCAAATNAKACETARALEAEQKTATTDENTHIEAVRDVKTQQTTLEDKRKVEGEARTQSTAADEKVTKTQGELDKLKADAATKKTAHETAVRDRDTAKAAYDQQAASVSDPSGATDGAAAAQADQTKALQDAYLAAEAKVAPAKAAMEAADKLVTEKEGVLTTDKADQTKKKEALTKAEGETRTQTEVLTKASKKEEEASTARTKTTGSLADSFRAKGSQAYRCPDFKVTPLALALTHTKYSTFKQVKQAMLDRIKNDSQTNLFAGGQTPTTKEGTKKELERLLGSDGLGKELTSRDKFMGNLGNLMSDYSKTRKGVNDDLLKPASQWTAPSPMTDQQAANELTRPANVPAGSMKDAKGNWTARDGKMWDSAGKLINDAPSAAFKDRPSTVPSTAVLANGVWTSPTGRQWSSTGQPMGNRNQPPGSLTLPNGGWRTQNGDTYDPDGKKVSTPVTLTA